MFASILIKVDLPEPLRPTSETIWPGSTDRLKDSKLQIFGEETKIHLKTDLPSNYIWENMHVTDK